MKSDHAGRYRVYVSLALLVAIAGLAPAALRAQAPTGTIGGTVTDATGASVPRATVTIFNVKQNRNERVVVTDAAGNYVAPFLSVSTYNLTVEAPGFKKVVREGIVLNVDDHLAINVALEVGATKQTVTVEDTPVHIETSSSVMSTTVNGTQIREDALITRNYERLVSLMPGVVSNSVDQLYPGVSVPGGTATNPYSINGSRNSMNAWLVDGADNEDRGSNQTLLNTPSVDALDQFKVERNGYEAQTGRAGAAQIEVVTKSGTSAFHGDAFEFVRNDTFAANNFYNNATNVNLVNGKAAVPPLRYNNFGWTLGGPIYIPGHYNTEKNKTFFFFSEEFRRIITYTTPTATLPTLPEVQGTFPNAVCTSYTGSACNTTSTTIASTSFDPVAKEYITDIYNKITLPAGTNTLPISARNYFGFEQELYKVDQVFGPKLTLSARFLRDQIPTAEPGGLFQSGALPAVYATSTNAPGHNWVVHATSTLSPTWLNEAGYNFSYGAIISNPVGLANSTYSRDVKVSLPYPVTLTLVPTLAFSGGGTGVGSEGNYRDFNRNHQIFDNLSKIHGPHTLRFGFTYYHYQKTENAAGGNQGSFSFTPASVPSGATTYQQSWANFLVGNVSSFTQTSLDITPDIRANQYEMYAQDDWKIKSNLTVNFGVRYSIFRQPTDAKGQNVDFDPAAYSAANAPRLVVGSTNTTLPVGTPLPYTNGVILGGRNSPFGTAVASQDNRDIAPRLGFAWDPFKTGKTSVRGGYGIYYDATLYGIYEQNIFADPPIVNSVNIPNTTLSNPTGGTASVSYSPIGLHATTNQFHTPYVQQWSLEFQREVAHNFQLNVGYVGSKGTHLLGIVDINNSAPGLAWSSGLVSSTTVFTSANEGLLNALRPYQGYNYINNIEPWFNSNYHCPSDQRPEALRRKFIHWVRLHLVAGDD